MSDRKREPRSLGKGEATSRGRGRDARIAPIRWNGLPVRAVRFVVADDAPAAMDSAVTRLESEGFASGDGEFAQKVTATGSDWIARDLSLGDIRTSWKRGAVDWFLEGTGLDLIPGFWRGATPTLVVACARPGSVGTELLIATHVSVRGGSDSNDAGPLLLRAADALEKDFVARDVLVSREKLWKIENDGSPASQKVVRDLLGWR